MPIINAVSSTWLTGKVYLPQSAVAMNVPFISFSSKQISDRNTLTDIPYGFPYEKIFNVGNTYWQTDFTCPMLVLEAYQTPSAPFYNFYQCIYEFVSEIISAAGFKSGAAFTANSLKNKWDFDGTETIVNANSDYVIQKISIDITDSESSFTVSIISTIDIRPYFNIYRKVNDQTDTPFLNNIVYRTVSPYDIIIPSDCIGAPFYFQQSSVHQWPQQLYGGSAYTSLLRELHLSIDSNVIQVPTIGMPTSRAFLGVNSIKCTGNIKYIPLYYSGSTVNFQPIGAGFAPAGFSVDMAAIDYITNSQRHGGKLQVSLDMINPMYVGAYIKNVNRYIIDGKNSNTPLGPVSISNWGLSSSGGQINTIDCQFFTSIGLTSF